MDLWIRSQDKRILRKANHLKIEIQNGDEYCIVEQETIYGKYRTKARALNILDKIEDAMTIDYKGKCDTYEAADLVIKSVMAENMLKIYDMPKE